MSCEPARAGAVKVGRHSGSATSINVSRPHLDGSEHGGTLAVIGMTMSQLAEANRALFRRALMRPGDTERDLGLRFAEAAKAMMPLVGELLSLIEEAQAEGRVRSADEALALAKAWLAGRQETT